MKYFEIPVFTGSDTGCDLRYWLNWLENFFSLYEYNDEEKMQFAFGFIYEEAVAYYLRCDSWNELRDCLLMRFGEDDDPERRKLQTEAEMLKETSTILEDVTLPSESLIQSCSSVAVKIQDESSSSSEAVPENELLRKTTSPTINEVLDDCFTEDQEAERSAIPHLTTLSVFQPLYTENSCALDRVSASQTCVCEINHELQKIVSSVTEETEENHVKQSAEMPHLWTTIWRPASVHDSFEHSDGISYEMQPDYLSTEEAKTSLNVSLQSRRVQQTFAQSHMSRRLYSKKKKGKYPKAWKYKFKSQNFQRWVNSKQVIESEDWVDQLVDVKRQGRFPKAGKFMFRTKNLQRFKTTRVKHLKPVADFVFGGSRQDMLSLRRVQSQTTVVTTHLQFTTFHQDYIHRRRGWVLHNITGELTDGTALNVMLEHIEEGCRLLNGCSMRFEKLLFSISVYGSFWTVDRVTTDVISVGAGEFHVKHKWRSKQSNQASVLKFVLEQVVCVRTELMYGQKLIGSSVGWKNIMAQMWNGFGTIHDSWESCEYQLRWRLHQGLKRYMRQDHSSIWHRWRYKTLECASVLHEWSGVIWQWWCLILQQRGSFYESYSIVMLSSSLRSSLISREGVYMRVQAGLLIMGVLVGWFTVASEYDSFRKMVREQKEKTKPCIHKMVRVENQQSLKENDFTELHVKRQQGHVLIHQQKQWKKFYKSWMFKYKERLKQMQVLPLHVVLSLWSNSCSVWHRWRSKVDSTGPAEMVGELEWLISIEIEAGTFKAYRFAVFSSLWRSCQFMNGRDGVFFSYKLEGKLVLVDGSIDRLLLAPL